jgi:hypothetical protein
MIPLFYIYQRGLAKPPLPLPYPFIPLSIMSNLDHEYVLCWRVGVIATVCVGGL